MKKHYLVAPVALVVGLLAACADPPPPSLAQVTIDKTSGDAGFIFTRDANGSVINNATSGITIGDGLSYVVTTSRRISDPPDKAADSDALLDKPFTLVVQGDAFTVVKSTTQSSQVIIHTVKQGDGALVFSVEGATGTVTMPVHVVDQNKIPADVYPPDLPRPVAEAGTADAGTSTGIDASGP